MDDYMSKPAPLADLQALLEKWLPVAQTGAASVPLDVQVLRAQVGDDPLMLAEFLGDFQVSIQGLAQDIAQAFAASDARAMDVAAHKLKSAARAVGARALGEVCAEMENRSGAGQMQALSSVFARFQAEVQAVQAHLASILASDSRESPP